MIVCLSYKRKPWIVRYREPWSGKQRQKAFLTEQEARAFEAAQHIVFAREKEIIRAVRRRKRQKQLVPLSVADVLGRYLDSLGNPGTRMTCAYHLRPLIAIYGQRRAHCLGVEEMAAFMRVQQARGVSHSTAYRRMSIVRTAYNWATRWGLLPVNPLAGLRVPSPVPQTPAPPTARELRLIYAVAAPHVQRVIALGMATGARIGPSELFRLRWTDVDIKGATLRMPQAAKGARLEAREIPLRRDILDPLRRWEQQDAAAGCPWVIHYKGRSLRSISRAWHNALRRAGIARRIRPYDLRHGFASRTLDNTADLKCVAEIMGHANEKMIIRFYRHTSAKQRRKAVEAAPALGLE